MAESKKTKKPSNDKSLKERLNYATEQLTKHDVEFSIVERCFAM